MRLNGNTKAFLLPPGFVVVVLCVFLRLVDGYEVHTRLLGMGDTIGWKVELGSHQASS